jgi:MoxR-like ATPase
MKVDIYKGTEVGSPDSPVKLEQVFRDDDPAGYAAGPALAAAVNVALVLGKPLLLTGEPGTGKTELARHVALALGLGEIERFDTRSTSEAIELFYRFDNLARFHAASAQEKNKHALDFITFGPLGRAILQSLPPEHGLFKILAINSHSLSGPRRSVVLIDEIDKAPRDFPNDLLDSIDNLRFSIRELEADLVTQLTTACGCPEITADRTLRPVVIITSNSEKNLPAAFLRRCAYHHIKFPGPERLAAIVARRCRRVDGGRGSQPLTKLDDKALAQAGEVSESQTLPLLQSVVRFFSEVRLADLSKPPSTAELIEWVSYLIQSGVHATQELKSVPSLVHESLGLLAKSAEDLAAVSELASAKIAPPPDDIRNG